MKTNFSKTLFSMPGVGTSGVVEILPAVALVISGGKVTGIKISWLSFSFSIYF